tara:strand:- start:370 stop:1782 length:1413 start_codon:yes stop_codon:yes gene_type:complete
MCKKIINLVGFKKAVYLSFLILTSFICNSATAEEYTFDLIWSDGMSGTANGSITFDTLTVSSSTSLTTIPSFVTGTSMTFTGVTYTLSSVTPIIGMWFDLVNNPTTLDTSTSNQLGSFNDLNFFTGACLDGFGANTVGDCNSGFWYLQSFIYASTPNSVSAADTQASITPNAYALRGTFSQQTAIINNGLNYDCTTSDVKGICLSAGGRVMDTNNPSTNSQGALLIASYRANNQWRIGGYLDQNVSSNDARGVNLNNSNPMGGVFAVWNQSLDGAGYKVRLAAGYSDKDVTISRSAFGATGEAGTGDSSVQSQAYSATLSRGFQISDSRWIASPYLGVRYTKIKRASYTEDSSVLVTTPLTYSGLSQETTTAFAGVRMNGMINDKVALMASAGIENDIAHNTGDYAASGVDGLTAVGFNQNIRHMRPTASAGASYAIDKRQTIGANFNYRQEAFNSTNSVSGMVNYQIGF